MELNLTPSNWWGMEDIVFSYITYVSFVYILDKNIQYIYVTNN